MEEIWVSTVALASNALHNLLLLFVVFGPLVSVVHTARGLQSLQYGLIVIHYLRQLPDAVRAIE